MANKSKTLSELELKEMNGKTLIKVLGALTISDLIWYSVLGYVFIKVIFF